MEIMYVTVKCDGKKTEIIIMFQVLNSNDREIIY